MAGKRIRLLDELRGLCVLLMIFFHAFYTLGYMMGWDFFRDLFWFFMPAEPVFAGIFIALCGYSCHLSHNNWKRGALLLLVAITMSAFLWFFMRGNMIWFGILHCLAICILLFALAERPLSKIPIWLGLPLCMLLFALTYHLPIVGSGGYIGIRGLFTVATPNLGAAGYPIGMGIVAAEDYFPLLPWAFLFLAGSFLGRWGSHGLPAFFYKDHIRPLSFLGRHALIIYIAHQPVIYGLAWLIRYLFL